MEEIAVKNFKMFRESQNSDDENTFDERNSECPYDEPEVVIPNHPTTQMLVQNLTALGSPVLMENKITDPPSHRISRKLTRPQRQQKLEQHLEEQLERINESKSRFDKQTNTESHIGRPNQGAVIRGTHCGQHQSSLSDPVNFSMKRSQTFNNFPGQISNQDYICRVSFFNLVICTKIKKVTSFQSQPTLKLNRSDSDSAMPLYKRMPFRRRILERRSLRIPPTSALILPPRVHINSNG